MSIPCVCGKCNMNFYIYLIFACQGLSNKQQSANLTGHQGLKNVTCHSRSKVASATSAMKSVFLQEVQQQDSHVVCCFGCLPAACLMKCLGEQCYTEIEVAIAFT
ncbi:hypothetical protein PVAP13_7NG364425 [Panicum virgatum]|uniref:Uncharacterized protein n=1 Tax=Panicum virgatum TaxID=38727 RepID=A0A8T0Q261_PANVG|nr:hypothetical protein PVAP13_7NG364425 [Panicum virgatum]